MTVWRATLGPTPTVCFLCATFCLGIAFGCSKPSEKLGKSETKEGGPSAPPLRDASVLLEHFASPSLRCSECHGEIATEWRTSAHATADRTPLFRAMRAAAGQSSCDGCHAPIRSRILPDDPAAADAIGCDACHLMTDIVPKREGMGFALRLDDTTRYGPLCDAKNHYFHKMGCSPIHGRSQMCSACHLYYLSTANGPLAIFTEYEEWEKSRHASGSECQDCHMPSRVAAAAAGARVRGLSSHDFRPDIRREAIQMKVALEENPQGELEGVVSLLHNGAGHSVPTGLPEHRIVLRVALHDASQTKTQEWERTYGRVLVDDRGREAPFYRATRIEKDTRIAVDETRIERFPLRVSTGGELVATLEWHRVSARIADELRVERDVVQLVSGRLRFAAPREGHVTLPKPVTAKP